MRLSSTVPVALAACLLAACGRGQPPAQPVAAPPAPDTTTYAMDDFASVRKFDAHVHANADSTAFLEQARSDGFELLSINVDYPAFPPVADQHAIALKQAAADPARFHWAATFTMQGFGDAGWAQATGNALAAEVASGARAVKIWKNIGMVEKDADGRLIMLDHPGLEPVVQRIQALGIPLIGHQGEPHNCWLPLEQMTTDNDREYFGNHPEYHMYLQPDQPGYEDHMAVRDRFLAAHPQLRFVGAHMASLEWDVERLGAFLDRFPDATVDLAARMAQVQYQAVREPAKVRDFFIAYQDRLLYGTDLTQDPAGDPAAFKAAAHDVWRSDWMFLATDGVQRIDTIRADVPGLALPRTVIDKVYYGNAARVFGAGAR
ncbi:amidohydrolase family protein [Xanthomonas sp. XNM01]|uniref:amidohydrolase family protein n=1 Tax=Xanthomonas sp. XNM01 TaxID=2769289 RepID=UPI0017818B98|nr:amidohydrolase family protein [Xanthomonas sp. XNM01]MBD9369761.1 amidohydrolase family protein [Xanthomonas sp. XNM01]